MEKEPKSIVSEAYKKLRTNIQYSACDKKIQVILITSSVPEEGKSITAGNLALSLSQDFKKVIIIDCDLRKPSLHKKFGISNEKGLVEVILRKEPLLKTIHSYKETLDILTTGKLPPNPAEMLGSENMKKLLFELKEHYDYVIIDTPPVLAVADAGVLAKRVDGVVFVVRANKTKKNSIIQAKKQLDNLSVPILGSVLNAIDTSSQVSNYYYYYSEK